MEDAAAAVRRLLPTAVPARLLLPALASHLPLAMVIAHLSECTPATCHGGARDHLPAPVRLDFNNSLPQPAWHSAPCPRLHAQRTGARSTAQLLDIAAGLLSVQKPGAAILHAEATFQLLLPALDVRQTSAASFGPEGESLPHSVDFPPERADQQSLQMFMTSLGSGHKVSPRWSSMRWGQWRR